MVKGHILSYFFPPALSSVEIKWLQNYGITKKLFFPE
jgi:hypothetical protein